MKDKKTDSGFKSFIHARNTKKGAVAIILTVLIVAALILLNVVTVDLTSRYSLYADLTSNGAYRLQDVTAEYASTVEKDVDFYILCEETEFEDYGEYYIQANRLIHQFCESSPHINLHYINLTNNPSFTVDYPSVDWQSRHLCLVVCGDKYRVIEADDMFDYDQDSNGYYYITEQHIEQAIATAVLTVTSDHQTTVAVLTGQAEIDMSPFASLLSNNGYNLVSVDLTSGGIPDDAEFLIIHAPYVDISEDMADYLLGWLENNGEFGHDLIYFPSDKQNVTEYPNLNKVIAEYGMSVDYGYLDENDPSYMVLTFGSTCARFNYADTDYTKDLLYPSLPVYLYFTMPVNITDSTLAKPMLTSSESTSLHLLAENTDSDQQTFNGAAVGTRSNGSTDNEKSSHVVVIGSYEAINEEFISTKYFNNSAYFVNVFNALSVNENIGVVIEGKNLSSASLGADQASAAIINIIVRYVIPAAVLIAGLIIWIIRRRR